MASRLPFDRLAFQSFQRTYGARLPGPISCLLALVLCPIGLVIGLVMIVASLLPLGRARRQAAVQARSAAPAGAREQALARLVHVLSMDETFTLDDARQAGTLAAGGATVDELLDDALLRGWVERRGERLAVTPLGRRESESVVREEA